MALRMAKLSTINTLARFDLSALTRSQTLVAQRHFGFHSLASRLCLSGMVRVSLISATVEGVASARIASSLSRQLGSSTASPIHITG